LKVNGATVTGFVATTNTYSVVLPYGTTALPIVAATTTDANATKVITQVTSLSASATVDVTAEDGTTKKTYTVEFSVAKNSAAEIVSFTLPGQIGNSVINSTARTILITLPAGTNANQIATFTLSSGASAKVGTVAQVSGTTSNDFTAAVIYKITAENGTSILDWTVTVQFSTGIDDISSENDFNVFPNPSNGNFSVKAVENATVIITDIHGKIILRDQIKSSVKTFDIGNQANGLYLIKINSQNSSKTKVLIKQ